MPPQTEQTALSQDQQQKFLRDFDQIVEMAQTVWGDTEYEEKLIEALRSPDHMAYLRHEFNTIGQKAQRPS